MKQGSSLKNFILGVAVISLIMFAHVLLITEIKRINSEKIKKLEILNGKLNVEKAKYVGVQMLTSEERIVKFAQDSLALIRPKENLEIITVPKDQINQIEKLVNEKYD
jgi:hypothetical protein